MKKLFSFMLICLLGITLTSCGSDDEPNSGGNGNGNGISENFFVGYWLVDSEEVFDLKPGGELDYYVLKTPGNTSVYSEKLSGTWKFNPTTDELTYHIQGEGRETIKVEYDEDDNTWFADEDGWDWERIYSLPKADSGSGSGSSDDSKKFNTSDFIGFWSAGSYVYDLGSSNKLTIYHVTGDNRYDEKMTGSWSFNSNGNRLEVSYKENEYGTTVHDSWEVISVTHDYIQLEHTKWTRTSAPLFSTDSYLVGTWEGSYDSGDIDIEITFSSNHSFTMRENADGDKLNTKGSWSISGDYLSFVYKGNESWLSNTLGSKLMIYDVIPGGIVLYGGGQSMTLKKK